MKFLAILLALIFTASSMAGAPYGVKGQGQAAVIYPNVHQVPNNQVTPIGGINALLETGNKNLLTNPSFEHTTATTGWTVGGVGAEELTVVIDGKKSLKMTATASTFAVLQNPTLYNQQFADGVQGLAMARVKTSVAGIKLCSVQAGTTSTTNCVTHTGSGKWELLKVPFILGNASNGISIATSATSTGVVYIDDAFVGATDLKVDGVSVTYQGSYFTSATSFTNTAIIGALTFSNGSGNYSYNASNGTYTMLKANCQVAISAGMLNTAAAPAQPSIYNNYGLIGITTGSSSAGQYSTASFTGVLDKGDVVSVSNTAANATTGTRVSFSSSCSERSATYSSTGSNLNATKVRAAGNAGTTYTDSVTNIPFIEIEDNKDAFDGTVFTAPEDGIFDIDGNVISVANAVGRFAGAYVDTGSGYALVRALSNRDGSTEDILKFQGKIYLSKGHKLAIRILNASGTLSNSSVFHYLNITKLTDANIIIGQFNGLESCADSYQCTDSYTANVSSTGVVTGENLDWINGNCVIGSQPFVCTFKSGLFTVAPNCTFGFPAGQAISQAQSATTSSGTSVYTYNSSGAGAIGSFVLNCQKQGVDFQGKTAKAVSPDFLKYYGFSTRKSTTQTWASNTTATIASWDVVDKNDGNFNATTGKYTIPMDGFYTMDGRVTAATHFGNGYCNITDGTRAYDLLASAPAVANQGIYFQGGATAYWSAGTVIYIECFQNSGATTGNKAQLNVNYFSMVRVPGVAF